MVGVASHGILAGPLAGQLVVPLPVRLVYPGNLGDQRVVRVRVAQQRADGQQHCNGKPTISLQFVDGTEEYNADEEPGVATPHNDNPSLAGDITFPDKAR